MQNRNNRLSSNSDITKKEIESLGVTVTTLKESNSRILLKSLRNSSSHLNCNVNDSEAQN